MKKVRFFYIFFILFTFLYASCSYQESFTYSGRRKINFVSDSLYFSFGKEPFSVIDTTIKIKVELIGLPSDSPLAFRIKMESSRTTAKEREHFEPFPEDYTISPGQSSSIIPIKIYRRKLDENRSYVIRLELIPTQDLELGAVEACGIGICFNNSLDKPVWWNTLSIWLGEYDVRKYQKFIEIYGKPVGADDVIANKYGILRVFKKVKEFFEAEPSYGVLFPDAVWPV